MYYSDSRKKMLNLQVYSQFRKENRSECGNLDTERQIFHVFSYR